MGREAMITLEEITNLNFKSAVIDSIENGRAALTHYIQNHENGSSGTYKHAATAYLKYILEYKHPKEEIDNSLLNVVIGALTEDIEKSGIPFLHQNGSKFTFIDLFAGIGGIRLAAQRLGGKCVYSSEWDVSAQQTYQANFGETPFGDITKKEIKEFIPKNFDMLVAGFPCQPFSYAGLNQGFKDATRGTLFFHILEILQTHQPPMFLLENVKGLKSHDKGKTLVTIEESLQNLGYSIKWQILNSYHFGLPQYRERWYCVGFKNKADFKFPVGTLKGATLKDIIDPEANEDRRLRLSDFEIERIEHHFKSKDIRVKHDNAKYAVNTKKGKHGVYSFLKPDGSLRFHIGDHAKTQIQEAFYACLNSYAPTIIANRVPKLLELRRRLSVLESQRLQGFPDNFEFPVSDNQAYKQLGNSVAVPVVEAVIREMLNVLQKE